MNEEHKKNDCLFYNDPESLLLESGQIILSLIHISEPTRPERPRMPSSA